MASPPGAMYRILRTLIGQRTWPAIQAALSATVPPVAQSQAYRYTRWLEFHGALVQRPQGYAVDLHRLLDLTAGVRRAHLVPTNTYKTTPEPTEVTRRLDEAGIRHAWGFATAANVHVFYEPLRDLQLYVHTDDADGLKETLPQGDASMETYAERIDELPTDTIRGMQVTELLATAIDVRAHPNGGAWADLLERALAEAAR